MGDFGWSKLKFLESSGNLKPLIKTRLGRTPSTSAAREISTCLQQGRLFYEAAGVSPLEIRPLLLFYGMVGFAKGLVLARSLRSLSSLKHSHGISDVSAQNSRISELKIKIGTSGTFEEFNDTVSELNRICYHGEATTPSAVYIPTTKSDQLKGLEITIKDILSRMPGLEDLYLNTFQESANTAPLMIHFWHEYEGYCEIRIDDSELYRSRAGLRNIVNRWRDRYPFLRQWCLTSAAHAWGNSVVEFSNVDNSGIDEFGENYLQQQNGQLLAKQDPRHQGNIERIKFTTILAPLAGGYSAGNAWAIAPIQDMYFSEFSLHYLALYLLSSLVRYRPHTWGHAISRTATAESPPDDEILALVEQFMNINQHLIPQMIVTVINPHEDKYT